MENESGFDANAELAALGAATRGYGNARPGEAWYHLILGLGAGVVVAAQGFSMPWSILAPLAIVLTIPALIAWWRSTHGWWVSGYGPTKARWIAIAMVPILGAAAFWSFVADNLLVSIIAGAAAAAAVTLLGFAWMAVWRREIRKGRVD